MEKVKSQQMHATYCYAVSLNLGFVNEIEIFLHASLHFIMLFLMNRHGLYEKKYKIILYVRFAI
jgi:hypothetical protein